MAAGAILDFIFVHYFGTRVCWTSNVIYMPNFVQICAIVNEFWAIDEIQNNGRRHLEFIIFVHFGQMVYIRWQPSTSMQNFIHLRQSAAKILLFVQKSKMAAAAILSYSFVMLDHPRSPFVHLKFSFKFCVDWVQTFRDKVWSTYYLSSGVFRGRPTVRCPPPLAWPWIFLTRLYMKKCVFLPFPARIAKLNNVWWFFFHTDTICD